MFIPMGETASVFSQPSDSVARWFHSMGGTSLEPPSLLSTAESWIHCVTETSLTTERLRTRSLLMDDVLHPSGGVGEGVMEVSRNTFFLIFVRLIRAGRRFLFLFPMNNDLTKGLRRFNVIP